MSALSVDELDSIIEKIIADFGDGKFQKGRYLFEQIKKNPDNTSYQTIGLSAAFKHIEDEVLILLIDSHWNNRPFANQAVELIGETGFGFKLMKSEIMNLLKLENCDMYVTSLDGRLLIAACHEHEVIDGERQIFAVTWNANT